MVTCWAAVTSSSAVLAPAPKFTSLAAVIKIEPLLGSPWVSVLVAVTDSWKLNVSS